MASADPVLERLKALHPKSIDLSLDRIAELLADLGHPERQLAPVIHVAGSKGKGSTVAVLRAVLEADGKVVHAYTSPHLVRFNERIRIAGGLIEEPHLAALLEEVERTNAGRPITFFEVTTAAAFLAFARTHADVVLLEVGLGGRLDATNLVEKPLASVLAPISMDHMHFLGDTLPQIAAEKAGIIKQNVPAIIGLQPPAALEICLARAAELDAPLFRRGEEWQVETAPDGFIYHGRRRLLLPRPSLPGQHQVDNAALAIATLDRAGLLPASREPIAKGLRSIDWPARLQRLTHGPLAALLAKDAALWLDGGHNEASGEVLAAWLKEQPGKFDLVVGMLSTKLADRFLFHLAPFTQRLRAVVVPNEQASLPAEAVAAAAKSVGIADVDTAASVAAAVASLAPGAQRVMITGSLYLAGHVLSDNG